MFQWRDVVATKTLSSDGLEAESAEILGSAYIVFQGELQMVLLGQWMNKVVLIW